MWNTYKDRYQYGFKDFVLHASPLFTNFAYSALHSLMHVSKEIN